MVFVRCEVCGRHIRGRPLKAIIEGAKMVVCGECVKLGTIYFETKAPAGLKINKRAPKLSAKNSSKTFYEEFELVNDFSSRIREAREKQVLSHEDLGKKIGEKVSILKKIERGKMIPDNKLAKKLSHALKVKLLVSGLELKPPKSFSQPPTITLGEIVELKRKKKEED